MVQFLTRLFVITISQHSTWGGVEDGPSENSVCNIGLYA